MKKIYIYPTKLQRSWTLILICFTLSAKADYWTQKADFPGTSRTLAFSFSIGSKGYAGCGADSSLNMLQDFWEYDPASNIWTQKANFPGSPRRGALGFSINNFGYAGMGGTNLFTNNHQDFWQYNPVLNSWTQKADFGGGPRWSPFGFVINSKGYAGTGYNQSTGFKNDLWEYDPVLNTWTQKANYSFHVHNSTGFSIGSNGFAGTGYDGGTGNLLNDFWQYVPVINAWTQKANLPGQGRTDATSFSIGNRGYIGTGDLLGTLLNDFYEYDPTNNSWTQKANYGGAPTDEAIGFSIGNKGYLGLGNDQSFSGIHEFWEYTPDSITGIEEIQNNNLQFSISPNPAKEFIVIKSEFGPKEKINVTITNAQGKKVFETQLETKTLNYKLQTSNFSKGVYFVIAGNGKEKSVRKFLKE